MHQVLKNSPRLSAFEYADRLARPAEGFSPAVDIRCVEVTTRTKFSPQRCQKRAFRQIGRLWISHL